MSEEKVQEKEEIQNEQDVKKAENASNDASETEKNASSAEPKDIKDNTEDKAQSEETASEKEETPEEKIARLEKENAELKDQYLRKAADFENYRKRAIADKQDAIDYANTSLLKDLLDSLDNFDRTVEAAATATDAKSIADGVTMINKSLVSMLENKYNLVSYGAAGDAFNPDIHEAIGMQEGDVQEEQVSAVYLKGYKLRDRVIRHAKVMVTKPKN